MSEHRQVALLVEKIEAFALPLTEDIKDREKSSRNRHEPAYNKFCHELKAVNLESSEQ